MPSKEVLIQMKEGTVRLKKTKNKPIRKMAEILGVGKSTIWYIHEKEGMHWGTHGRQLKRMISKFFLW